MSVVREGMQRRRNVEKRDRREDEEQDADRRVEKCVQLSSVVSARSAEVSVVDDLSECRVAERTPERAEQQKVRIHFGVIRAKYGEEQDGRNDQTRNGDHRQASPTGFGEGVHQNEIPGEIADGRDHAGHVRSHGTGDGRAEREAGDAESGSSEADEEHREGEPQEAGIVVCCEHRVPAGTPRDVRANRLSRRVYRQRESCIGRGSGGFEGVLHGGDGVLVGRVIVKRNHSWKARSTPQCRDDRCMPTGRVRRRSRVSPTCIIASALLIRGG